MPAAQIELEGIERVFHLGDSEVHALREVQLQIAAGEYLAVMGPSGSGKSTLLNLLGLLDRDGRLVGLVTEEDFMKIASRLLEAELSR